MPPRASSPTLPLTPSRVCRGGPHGNQRLCQEVRRQASCFLTQKGWRAWNTSGSWELRLAPTSRPGPPAGRRGHPCRARRRHRDTSRRQLAFRHADPHRRRHPPGPTPPPATRRRSAWCSTGIEVTWRRSTSGRGGSPPALTSAGVGPGDRVAFLDKNGIEHFEVMFGAAFCNAVPVDVNWRLAPPEIAYIVDDCGAKVLVVGADFVAVLDAIAAGLPRGTSRARDRRALRASRATTTWVEGNDDADPHAADRTADDTALQLYSSGTTGRPKGVMLSNHNLLALLPAGRRHVGLRPSARSTSWRCRCSTSAAAAGRSSACTSAPAACILRDLDPAALVDLIGDERRHPRLPRAGRAAVHADGARRRRRRLSSLETHRLRRLADQRGRAVAQHGAARVRLLAGVRAHRDHRRRSSTSRRRPRPRPAPTAIALRSCGRPGPGVEVRIVAPDTDTGADADIGAVGEIWVRGPQVMTGLLERRRGHAPRPSTPRAGSAPATPATSTPTATSTSTTGSRT